MENVFNLDWYNIPFVNVCSKDRLVKGVGSVEGNQKKWRYKDYVVKLDLLGYESTAEILTSHLLRFSDIDPNRYATYYPCIILEDGIAQGRGCYAKDFAKGYCEMTFRDILESNLMSTTSSYDEVRDVILDTTGIDFKSYIDNVLCLDAITFNDDRHFGNFSLLYNSKEWKSVIYDNGGGCLSDVMSYPLQEDYKYLCSHVLAKPFSEFFTEQIRFATPIRIRYSDFINSVKVDYTEGIRAFNVIKYGLEKTRGIAWEEY